MTAISRKNAKALGSKYYWTGKPCKRGHIDKRFVSSFACMTCAREKANECYAALDTDSRTRVYRERLDGNKQWRESHRSQLLAYAAAKNKARKESNPDYFKQHYAKNKERRKHESMAWYYANAEYAAQRQKAYVADHLEQTRETGRRGANKRRAIKKRVFVEVVDPRTVFARDKGICGICLGPVEMTSHWEIDHVTPISRGGAHSYDNTQLTHRKCNRSKAAKLIKGQPTLFQVVT